MNHSKNPLNLCDAIQRFADDGSTKERVLENQSTETMYSSGNILVDVLAVVIRISHPQEDRTELWMADPSIETRKKNASEIRVMVTLFGRENAKLKVGDVIRFNGLSLRRKIIRGGSNKNNRTKHSTQRTTTTCEFVQSWNTTHPGAAVEHALFVLGHASAEDSRLMKRIPETMETHANLIQGLMDWYPTSSYAVQSRERLSTLPCQRRTLEEVTASLGVIGHVQVNILSLEASIAEKKSPAKKRKRASNAAKTYHMVTVSDVTIGGNPVMFVHSIHSLVAVLQKAFAENHPVILHNVVCRKGRDIPSWFTHQHHPNEETVLMATSTTYAVPVPATSELLVSKVQTHAMGQSQTQPFLSATQHSQHPSEAAGTIDSLVLEAPLYAMEFDATKLRKDHSVWTSREKVMILLLERGEDGAVSYRDAVLYLNHESVRNTKVHANASALQELCCGLEASELQQHPKYQNHVIAFLRGLLDDKVILRWKLCRDSGKDGAYNVETVTLIEL